MGSDRENQHIWMLAAVSACRDLMAICRSMHAGIRLARIPQCKTCGKSAQIKSNKGIAAQLQRISASLEPSVEPGCLTPGGSNARAGDFSNPKAHVCKACLKTSRRLRCKSCRRWFSVTKQLFGGQKQRHNNKTVFTAIVTKKLIRGIAQVTECSYEAVCDKIDFIYAQCRGFSGARNQGTSYQAEICAPERRSRQ